MKNILAENLLRFGVKNLKEADRAVLSEALLLEQTQQVTAAISALNAALKAKPTMIAGVGVYPEVSVTFTNNGLPQKGQDLGPIAKELYGVEANGKYNGNLAPGSKMPLSLTISVKSPDVNKIMTTNKNFFTYIKDLMSSKRKTWKFPYGYANMGHHGFINDPKISPAATEIIGYLNNFYVTSGDRFWSTPGVNAEPQTNAQTFNGAIVQLLNRIAEYPGIPYPPLGR